MNLPSSKRSIALSFAALVAASSLASAQSIQNLGDVWNGPASAPASPATPWSPTTLWVGKTGGSGSTVVKQGASISNASIVVVGFSAGSNGLLRVSDFGSAVTSTNAVVGSAGGQGRLEVLDGGRFQSTSLDIAWTDNVPNSASVLVRGAGSNLRITGGGFTTMADRAGCLADLTIADGGLYDTTADFYAAHTFPNSATDMGVATLSLTGVGSRLHVGGQLFLGQDASGAATLNIGTGTSVTVDSGFTVGKTGTVNLDGGTFGPGTGVLSTNDGVIRGGGTLTGTLVNSPTGTLGVAAGKELRLTASRSNDQFINRGRIENVGGTFALTLPGSNQSGAQIIGRDATFKLADRTAAVAFNNIGQIAFVGGQNNLVGPLTNSSKILIDNNAVVTFEGNVTNASELRVNAGSRAIFLGNLSGNGTVGSGSSSAFAVLQPGGNGTAGVMTFGGDLTIDRAAGSLAIDLGSQSDQVQTAGKASIGGTLALSMAATPAMYVPQRVVQAGSLVGRFDRVTGTIASPNVGFAVSYDATGATVVAAIPGDADLNRAVVFADLVTLAQHYNQASGQEWKTGDFTGDAGVGFDDLVVLAQHYGNRLLSDGAVIQAGSDFAADLLLAQSLVPEPATLLGGLLLLPLARRRK